LTIIRITKKFDVPLTKNAKMGQKINLYVKVMRIDSTCSKLLKTVGNVTGTDSIYSKLLKTVGLMIGVDSICSKLLKTVGHKK